MKKKLFFTMILLVAAVWIFGPAADADAPKKLPKKLVIFDEGGSIYAITGWMGDGMNAVKMENVRKRPHGGKYCLKFTYNAKKGKKEGWAGVYWQYPPDNWGDKKGLDLSRYKKVSFWARGEKGGEVINVRVGGCDGGDIPDTFCREVKEIHLNSEWKQITITFKGDDLSNVSGAFCWSVDSSANPKGCTFYLDDIVYE